MRLHVTDTGDSSPNGSVAPFEITVSLFRTEDEAREALAAVTQAVRSLPGLEHVEPALSRVA